MMGHNLIKASHRLALATVIVSTAAFISLAIVFLHQKNQEPSDTVHISIVDLVIAKPAAALQASTPAPNQTKKREAKHTESVTSKAIKKRDLNVEMKQPTGNNPLKYKVSKTLKARKESPKEKKERVPSPITQKASTSKATAKNVNKPTATLTAKKRDYRNNDKLLQQAISEVVKAIEKKKKYPRAAIRGGYGGLVYLNVYISSKGIVKKISLKLGSGYSRLDRAAMIAAKTLLECKIVTVELPDSLRAVIPIHFRLK